jgi:hypothetical protein
MTLHDHLFFAPLYDQQDRETSYEREFDAAMGALLADADEMSYLLGPLVPNEMDVDGIMAEAGITFATLFETSGADFIHSGLFGEGVVERFLRVVEDEAARRAERVR